MSPLSLVKKSWQNTKAMPGLLRMLCQGAMVAPPILLAFLVLPLTEWTVNGKSMSYPELWGSGAGVILGLVLLLAAIGGWGIAARVSAARWAWVAAPVLPVLLLPLFPQFAAGSSSSTLSSMGAGLVTSIVLYGALFHVGAVQRYFNQQPHAGA